MNREVICSNDDLAEKATSDESRWIGSPSYSLHAKAESFSNEHPRAGPVDGGPRERRKVLASA